MSRRLSVMRSLLLPPQLLTCRQTITLPRGSRIKNVALGTTGKPILYYLADPATTTTETREIMLVRDGEQFAEEDEEGNFATYLGTLIVDGCFVVHAFEWERGDW